MYNATLTYLQWDSDFFGRKIGKIDYDSSLNLSELLSYATNKNFELIYVFGNENFEVETEILEKYNGKLVDKKVLYHKQLTEISPISELIEYYEGNITKELENLAYTSGAFSRFRLDNNFSENDFRRMYKMWIKKSLNKQIADNVFIIYENTIIKGMVTLKINDSLGQIGLFAVSPDMQGKGYGTQLVQACENELLAHNIFALEVPTQADNRQACNFYEKYGFTVKSMTNIYHFVIRKCENMLIYPPPLIFINIFCAQSYEYRRAA